jgi:hypothetical protein
MSKSLIQESAPNDLITDPEILERFTSNEVLNIFKPLLEENTVNPMSILISGSTVTSLLINKDFKRVPLSENLYGHEIFKSRVDIDIYVYAPSAARVIRKFEKLYADNIDRTPIVVVEPSYDQSFLKRNKISAIFTYVLNDMGDMGDMGSIEVQFMIAGKNPKDVIYNFDLTCCENWYDGVNVGGSHLKDTNNMKCYLRDEYTNALINGNKFTLSRIEKYKNRGFDVLFMTRYINIKTPKDLYSEENTKRLSQIEPSFPKKYFNCDWEEISTKYLISRLVNIDVSKFNEELLEHFLTNAKKINIYLKDINLSTNDRFYREHRMRMTKVLSDEDNDFYLHGSYSVVTIGEVLNFCTVGYTLDNLMTFRDLDLEKFECLIMMVVNDLLLLMSNPRYLHFFHVFYTSVRKSLSEETMEILDILYVNIICSVKKEKHMEQIDFTFMYNEMSTEEMMDLIAENFPVSNSKDHVIKFPGMDIDVSSETYIYPTINKSRIARLKSVERDFKGLYEDVIAKAALRGDPGIKSHTRNEGELSAYNLDENSKGLTRKQYYKSMGVTKQEDIPEYDRQFIIAHEKWKKDNGL